MKLLVVGDSFAEGLIKEPKENTPLERSKINFGTQLSHLLNCEVVNLSWRGAGTNYIVHRIKQYIDNNSNEFLFVLIVLSGIQRYWHFHPDKGMYNPSHSQNFLCEMEHLFQIEMYIRGLHQYLDDKEIPHLFTNSYHDFKYFPNFEFGKQKVVDYWIEWDKDGNTLYNILNNTWLEPNNSNLDQTHNSPFEPKYTANCYHPNENGHKLIAKTLYPYIYPYFTK